MPRLTVVCTSRRPLADRRRPRSCATSCARASNRQATATASRPPPPASACHSSPAAGCTAAASGSFFVSPPPPPRLPQAIAPGSGQDRQLSARCGADESRSSLRDGGCRRAAATATGTSPMRLATTVSAVASARARWSGARGAETTRLDDECAPRTCVVLSRASGCRTGPRGRVCAGRCAPRARSGRPACRRAAVACCHLECACAWDTLFYLTGIAQIGSPLHSIRAHARRHSTQQHARCAPTAQLDQVYDRAVLRAG